jgi:hypothetical protein
MTRFHAPHCGAVDVEYPIGLKDLQVYIATRDDVHEFRLECTLGGCYIISVEEDVGVAVVYIS